MIVNRVKLCHRTSLRLMQFRRPGLDSLGQEDPLEKELAPHSSILVWEIPCTEEAGGLQSMGSQKSQTRLLD